MDSYERALTADPPPALVIAETATKADLDAQITATRDKLVTLENGSPEYKRVLSDYETLLAGHATAPTPAPTDEAPAPTPDEDHAAAESVTGIYADMLPEGMTWDVPVVASLRAVARTALGSDGDATLQGGIHAATAALREIATTGPPDPAQTEAALRSRWGSGYEHEIAAASEAWDAVPKGVQQMLTARGVRYSVPFIAYMAEVGAKLFNGPGGAERLAARLHEEA
ncbi:MAG TPA: hypothetical protein VML54_16205 [Candidatus Limnocylindrales bacterium]|nr:hypothetical protein [Candidatus Limnocylindrales bacterium]